MSSRSAAEWFGERGDAPIYDHIDETDVPVGDPCLHCPDPITEDDSGFTLPRIGQPGRHVAYHRDCFREHVLGGLPELGGTKR